MNLQLRNKEILNQVDILSKMYSKHLMTLSTINIGLKQKGKSLSGSLSPEDLFEFDQDHFFGLDATAECVNILKPNSNDLILDIGSGYGGPARFISRKTGAKIIGIEIQEDRYLASCNLTKKVGLDKNVSFVKGDINYEKIEPNHFTKAISYLTILHIINKKKTLQVISNAIKSSGKLFIEDYYRDRKLSDTEKENLLEVASCPNLLSKEEYLDELTKNGIEILSVTEMTDQWLTCVIDRFQNFKSKFDEYTSLYGKEETRNALEFAEGVYELFKKEIVHGFRIVGQKK